MFKIKTIKSSVHYSSIPKGFSLVELMVSVAITAILMVGISAFFSNGFQTMFASRQKVATSLNELVFSNVLQKNFMKTTAVQEIAGDKTSVILKNDPEIMPLSFTYLGEKEGKIGLKDFFVFNGQEGSTSSADFFKDISNPAGLTQLNGKYYVAAPLENAIYVCSGGCNSKLSIEGLKYPMDLATDGTNLFVTDAGNNRVVEIENVGTTNDLSVMASGLNFPTGLEYYSGGKGYLFVSDTYNHAVKKIQIGGDYITTVVGGGTNKNCDNTAEYCQLNYPTGLVLGNDGSGEALYIADTGNGRILKLVNPPALSEFELPFHSPEVVAAIKEIKFVFPTNTNLAGANLNSVTSDNGDLNEKGTLSISDNIFTYELWTKLLTDTQNSNKCAPLPCLSLKNKVEVINSQLFDANKFKEIKLADDANNNLTIGSKNGVKLTLAELYAVDHPAGSEVALASPVPAKTAINFKFSNVDTSTVAGGFRAVLAQMYDLEGKFLASQKSFFRFSDPELGTPEDMISVLSTNHPYPTGLGWSGNALVFSETAEYPKTFSDLDYVSDFEAEDFKITKKNDDKLLEISFKTLKNPNAEEEKIYEPHVFETALKS